MSKHAQRKKKREAKAAAKAAAAKAQQATTAKAVGQCPIQAAKEAEAARVAAAYDQVAKNGHAVQRHGDAITRQQLIDRAVNGIDPASGTTNDAYNKNADGTPKEHNYGRHATKFEDKAALVKADESIRKGDAFKKKLQDANAAGSSVIAVTDTKLADALGPEYKTKVSGVTREGSKNNPTGNTTPTDFTDGTIRAVYKKDDKGNWNVETMFPEPKP